jgi:hypothetical protein
MNLVPSLLRSLPCLIAGFWTAILTWDASGYVLENHSWPNGAVVTMEMELGALNQTLQDGSPSWNAAAAPAIDAWNAQMGRIQLAKVMDSSKPIASGDGINSTSFASTVFGDDFGTGVLAVTYYTFQGAAFKEADVLFNKAQTFDSYRGDLQFNDQGKCITDIQRVFLHELGHALGLNHPDGAGQHLDAVMNSVVSDLSQLSADDKAGIQFLYGTPGPTPTPSPLASQLVNISTRMRVGVGDGVLIGGFIIQGDEPKKVVLRAIGPSLGSSGVVGALQDPQMELRDGAGAIVDSNDNWQQGEGAAEIAADSIAPSDPREAAILATLAPGNYTVIVSGVNNTTGVGLVESYALDNGATRAANISTRGHVGAGDEALIGGFIIGGSDSKNILVRAIGPSLGGADALADPLVEVYDSAGQLITMNDNWNTSAQQGEIVATGIPPADARESAVIAALAPGNYTAVVRGADGGVGLGLVEIYDLSP